MMTTSAGSLDVSEVGQLFTLLTRLTEKVDGLAERVTRMEERLDALDHQIQRLTSVPAASPDKGFLAGVGSAAAAVGAGIAWLIPQLGSFIEHLRGK